MFQLAFEKCDSLNGGLFPALGSPFVWTCHRQRMLSRECRQGVQTGSIQPRGGKAAVRQHTACVLSHFGRVPHRVDRLIADGPIQSLRQTWPSPNDRFISH